MRRAQAIFYWKVSALNKQGESEIRRLLRQHYVFDGQAHQDFLHALARMACTELAYLHWYDEASEQLELGHYSRSVLQQGWHRHDNNLPLNRCGAWADVIRQRHWQIQNHYSQHDLRDLQAPIQLQLKHHLAIPLFQHHKLVAVVGLINQQQAFSEEQAVLISEFGQAAYLRLQNKLEKIRLAQHREVERLRAKDTISILISMVEVIYHTMALRDQYTAVHSAHVASISELIGRELKLPEDQIAGLRLGAMMHDIGKLAVPSDLLNKIGKLSKIELEVIRTHAEAGGKIFEGFESPWPIQEMVLQHHERLDGSGYPCGLKARDIVFEARIIAVADVFESMAANRPYRFAPGLQAAFDELRSGQGSRYDDFVVDALQRVWQKQGQNLQAILNQGSAQQFSLAQTVRSNFRQT